MRNQWLALDPQTYPQARVRQLRRSWERVLADGPTAFADHAREIGDVRRPIVESWQRSLLAGVDPVAGLAPLEADPAEARERWREHPLGSLAPLLIDQLRTIAEDSRNLVVVSDAGGLLLSLHGVGSLKERAAGEMNFVEGARWTEATAGTNAIGTVLAANHAVEVFASEHFNEGVHGWWCSAAPVHDPASGRILAVVDLTGPLETAHPLTLAAAVAAATTLERHLAHSQNKQDARLRRRYGAMATRSTDLVVSGDGRLLVGDGASWRQGTIAMPGDGGEVSLVDGSAAVAEPLGEGEAYLVRRLDQRARGISTMAALVRAEDRTRELAEEQAALRRVAILSARETSPDRLFAAVAEEVARVMKVPLVSMLRYEADGTATQLAGWSENGGLDLLGTRWLLDSPSVITSVWRTGRTGRLDECSDLSGPAADALRHAGIISAIANPIIAAGRPWGAMVVFSDRPEPPPEGTEARLADFTELIATAIANAESRAELIASRARVIAAADETRRRLERDLHDGMQQQLIALALALQSAGATVPADLPELRAQVSHVAQGLTSVLDELRELSRGIHPAILSSGGLGPALRTLGRRSAVPVELDIRCEQRLPEAVEVAAYYVVSEALANAAKHARASAVHVDLEADELAVHLAIRDDGVGGAASGRGSGLVGLRDRVEALGGTIEIVSPRGSGTVLRVEIPCVPNPDWHAPIGTRP